MRKFISLALPALEAMRERHDDPKNMAKGDYPTNIFELWGAFAAEQYEADVEITASVRASTPAEEYQTLLRVRSEVGDVMLYGAMLIKSVEDRLAELQSQGASK